MPNVAWLCDIYERLVSQGNAALSVRCGWQVLLCFEARTIGSTVQQELLKLLKLCISYGKNIFDVPSLRHKCTKLSNKQLQAKCYRTLLIGHTKQVKILKQIRKFLHASYANHINELIISSNTPYNAVQ